jgi:hypothetical protein
VIERHLYAMASLSSLAPISVLEWLSALTLDLANMDTDRCVLEYFCGGAAVVAH